MAASPSPQTRRNAAGPLLTRAVIALVYLAGAALGAVYGYGFGVQIGGPLMGVVTAVTGAVFCTILISGGIDRLLAWLRSGRV